MVGLLHLLNKGNTVIFINGEELTRCLGRANMCAVFENPYLINTELTFIDP